MAGQPKLQDRDHDQGCADDYGKEEGKPDGSDVSVTSGKNNPPRVATVICDLDALPHSVSVIFPNWDFGFAVVAIAVDELDVYVLVEAVLRVRSDVGYHSSRVNADALDRLVPVSKDAESNKATDEQDESRDTQQRSDPADAAHEVNPDLPCRDVRPVARVHGANLTRRPLERVDHTGRPRQRPRGWI
jgi:hypothetical protein